MTFQKFIHISGNINMGKLYVIDTTSLISYYSNIFQVSSKISKKALKIIENVIKNTSYDKISIPSIVFVEIFKKWFINEEFKSKFYYEIYTQIVNNPNIEIKPIEREVLEKMLIIDKTRVKENHDRIILASAMMLECPLITSDDNIIDYVITEKIIKKIIR
jgi:PIN domain nuclease of toxin-antitoxin system